MSETIKIIPPTPTDAEKNKFSITMDSSKGDHQSFTASTKSQAKSIILDNLPSETPGPQMAAASGKIDGLLARAPDQPVDLESGGCITVWIFRVCLWW
jgi:hypothetical protein